MTRRYALDVSALFGRRTGIGRYVDELLTGLLDARDDDEELTLYALTARHMLGGAGDSEPVQRALQRPRVRFRRIALPYRLVDAGWKILGMPSAETLAGAADVVHGTSYRLPPCRRAAGVVTIHDLAPLRFPDQVPPSFLRSFRDQVMGAVRRARAIVCDSDATRADVIELLGAPEDRTRTIHLGVSAAFHDAEDPAPVLRRLAIQGPYVLFVGTTHPRKNLGNLLLAFAAMRHRNRVPHRLVLVGDAGFADAAIREQIVAAGLTDVVTLPGFVQNADLPALYRGAALLAFPSFYEGFGLPVLEAMASGCPVVTSRGSSLEEIAGPAARLVDPADPDDIARGMAHVLLDAQVRDRLITEGLMRAADFSWGRTAREHLALYRELAGSPA